MTKKDFLRALMLEYYKLMHIQLRDNYDSRRFSYDGVDRAMHLEVAGHAGYLEFFMENHGDFFATWMMLKDEKSRQLFVRLILFRLLGHLHVQIRPGYGWQQEAELIAMARAYHAGPSPIDIAGMFGLPEHYRGIEAVDGRQVSIDGWVGSILFSFLKRQYFLQRDGVRVKPEPGDYVVDAGACLGDTAVAFACAVGEEGKVFAFDPLPAHQKATRHNLAQNNLCKVEFLPYALSDKSNAVEKSIALDAHTVRPGFCITDHKDALPVLSLDDFVTENKIPRLDFIKMDIEGSELAALKGAAKAIQKFRPRLAISLYHKPVDFVEIPHYIASAFPFYDFYLDHYTIHAEETVLYCAPKGLSS